MGWMRGPRPATVTVRSYNARKAAPPAGSVRHAVPAGSTTKSGWRTQIGT